MFANRHLRRLAASLAAFAILFATLAPSVSHALPAQQESHGGWAEICTMAGIRLVEVDVGEPAHVLPLDGKGPYFQHCPFCQPLAGALLPPPDTKPALAPQAVQRGPRLFLRASQRLHSWISARPRAPPFVS